MKIAVAARTLDSRTLEMQLAATESERNRLFAQMAAGQGRLLRVPITNEQPRTQMPKRAEPQFPEVGFLEALAQRPILRSIGRQ